MEDGQGGWLDGKRAKGCALMAVLGESEEGVHRLLRIQGWRNESESERRRKGQNVRERRTRPWRLLLLKRKSDVDVCKHSRHISTTSPNNGHRAKEEAQ